MRKIKSVSVVTSGGMAKSPAEAIAYIASIDRSHLDMPFTQCEVGVRYSNGDEIRGQFRDKSTAIVFLREIQQSLKTLS